MSRFKSSKSCHRCSNANAEFQFVFQSKTGSFSFQAYRQLILYFTIHTHVHVIYKAQLFAKICFSSLQDMRKEVSFRMIFEKVRASKRKLEIDDPRPPKKQFRVIMRKEKLL